MKKNYLFNLIIILSLTVGFTACEKGKIEPIHTLNLENLLPKKDSTWVGDTLGIEKNGTYINHFGDNFFVFNNFYTPKWSSWTGFALTNGTDTETGDFTNNSAITGEGVNGKVYLTVNNSAFSPAKITFKDNKERVIKGLYVTNTTYAYRVIENGNSFSRKFTNGDWFKLKIIALGKNNLAKDTTEVYLADFRNNRTEILDNWKWVNLEKMGKIKALTFELSSTDNGEYGMNTPSYFCIDEIKAIK